jgi:hypothetical protein
MGIQSTDFSSSRTWLGRGASKAYFWVALIWTHLPKQHFANYIKACPEFFPLREPSAARSTNTLVSDFVMIIAAPFDEQDDPLDAL